MSDPKIRGFFLRDLSAPSAQKLCLDIALMKYCRFDLNGSAHYGLVESVAGSEEITRLLLQPPQDSDGDVEGLPSRRMDRIPLAQASLLPPVEPSKIVCVGRCCFSSRHLRCCRRVERFFGQKFPSAPTTKVNWAS